MAQNKLTDEQLSQYISQREQQIEKQEKLSTETKNQKEIQEIYGKLQAYIQQVQTGSAKDSVKSKKMFELYKLMAPFAQNSEMKISKLNKEITWMRQDTDTFQKTEKILQQKKLNLKQMCDELRKASSNIKKETEAIQSKESDQAKKVQEVIQQQQEKLDEMKTEIDKMEKEKNEKEKENGEIKQYLDEQIEKYQIKEKLYIKEWNDVDEFQKERKKNIMKRISQIKNDASQMNVIKEQLQEKGKEQTDLKLKIGLYCHKYSELDDTIKKTGDLISNFKGEIQKIASQKKNKMEKKKKVIERTRKVDRTVILVQDQVVKFRRNVKKEQKLKDKMRAQLLKLQNQQQNYKVSNAQLKARIEAKNKKREQQEQQK